MHWSIYVLKTIGSIGVIKLTDWITDFWHWVKKFLQFEIEDWQMEVLQMELYMSGG